MDLEKLPEAFENNFYFSFAIFCFREKTVYGIR